MSRGVGTLITGTLIAASAVARCPCVGTPMAYNLEGSHLSPSPPPCIHSFIPPPVILSFVVEEHIYHGWCTAIPLGAYDPLEERRFLRL